MDLEAQGPKRNKCADRDNREMTTTCSLEGSDHSETNKIYEQNNYRKINGKKFQSQKRHLEPETVIKFKRPRLKRSYHRSNQPYSSRIQRQTDLRRDNRSESEYTTTSEQTNSID
uniref:Uncharacterized protein n=1 Tax=Setaria digitata TaxID=48799 RepID=A0A915Q5X1_9BILA